MNGTCRLALLTLLACASALAGCNETSTGDDRPLVVAAILNVSGTSSVVGEPTRRALDTYVEVYNRQPARTDSLVLVVEDAHSDPSRAPDALNAALRHDPAPAIVAVSTSPTTLAVLPHLPPELLLLANAGHPEITIGDTPGSPPSNRLGIFPVPEDEFAVIADLVGDGTAFLVHASDIYHQLGAGVLDSLLGPKLIGREAYDIGEADFSGIVRRIQDARPEHIVLTGIGASYVAFMNELLAKGVTTPLVVDLDLMSNSLSDYPAAIRERIRFVGTEAVESIEGTTLVHETIREYRARYGEPPKYYAVLLLDALDAAIEELREARGDVNQTVQGMIGRGRRRMGSGTLSFDPDHRIRINLVPYRLDGTGNAVALPYTNTSEG